MTVELTPEQLAIFAAIEDGDEHLFITGRAGTGKSTLLRHLTEHSKKQIIVCAPTGVAALNVGGQTIHSLLKLPLGVIADAPLRQSAELKRMLGKLDLLVIDEISMVNADLMDAIDRSLRQARGVRSVPFGGVQVVMFGDPYQLAPVPGDAEEARVLAQAQLLTAKPVLYVCNVEEGSAAEGNALSAKVFAKAKAEGAEAVVVSAAIEAEIATMPPEDRADFLSDLGLTETGLTRVIRAGYDLLHLITFFIAGPKESRAWTIPRGSRAPQAAGAIHSDFERGFIGAETIAFDDYVAFGGEAGARDAGKLRQEGKEYVVHDGDVMLFRFNV